MALGWIAPTSAFASVVRNENSRCVPGSSALRRWPYQLRQIPAKAKSGLSGDSLGEADFFRRKRPAPVGVNIQGADDFNAGEHGYRQ